MQTIPDNFVFVGSAASRIQQIGNAIPPLLARAMAEHIQTNYGFQGNYLGAVRPTLRFSLTRSEGMSPALARTEFLLTELTDARTDQLALLEQANP